MDVRAPHGKRVTASPDGKSKVFGGELSCQRRAAQGGLQKQAVLSLKNTRQLPHLVTYAESSSFGNNTNTNIIGSSSSTSTSSGGSSEGGCAVDPGLESFKALIANKRFFCTQCGKCCTGDGEVWISAAEASAIAQHLHLPLRRFLELHTRSYSKKVGWYMLRSNMDSEARECTFLRPDNTCAIHPVRPLQCSTYPWWPELMDDREWAWEKANICEGFDHLEAPQTNLADAALQLKLATTQEYQKMLAMKPSKKQPQVLENLNTASGMISSPSSNNFSSAADQQQECAERGAQKAVAWQLKLQVLSDKLAAADAQHEGNELAEDL